VGDLSEISLEAVAGVPGIVVEGTIDGDTAASFDADEAHLAGRAVLVRTGVGWRLDEALGLPIRARSVRLECASRGEELAQRAVERVAPGIVRHQALGLPCEAKKASPHSTKPVTVGAAELSSARTSSKGSARPELASEQRRGAKASVRRYPTRTSRAGGSANCSLIAASAVHPDVIEDNADLRRAVGFPTPRPSWGARSLSMEMRSSHSAMGGVTGSQTIAASGGTVLVVGLRDRSQLPSGIPAPEDDGAAAGIEGALPAVRLASTLGREVDLHEASAGRLVLYVYPRTGVPGQPSPPGWDAIPGARGCTPENCAFRDHKRELRELGATVMGLSAQRLAEQREFAERERIPYPLLTDSRLVLARELGLPTFDVVGMTLYKRLTLVAERRRIVKVFYPVFPPDRHPQEVVAWLSDPDAS